jgi:hypothetical protein
MDSEARRATTTMIFVIYYKKKSRVHKLKSSITSSPICSVDGTIPPQDSPLASS